MLGLDLFYLYSVVIMKHWQVILVEWLYLIIILTVALALIFTVMIGRSPSNKEENSRYTQQTGRNWLSLSLMYVGGILAVVLLLVTLL